MRFMIGNTQVRTGITLGKPSENWIPTGLEITLFRGEEEAKVIIRKDIGGTIRLFAYDWTCDPGGEPSVELTLLGLDGA